MREVQVLGGQHAARYMNFSIARCDSSVSFASGKDFKIGINSVTLLSITSFGLLEL